MTERYIAGILSCLTVFGGVAILAPIADGAYSGAKLFELRDFRRLPPPDWNDNSR